MKPRPNYMAVWNELAADKSMVFISGPRQVGKTTLAKSISHNFANHIYFNWDIPGDRAQLIENPAFFETVERKAPSFPLVIFDEIHKYRDWKNYLKGIYDRFYDQFRFLVTGSSRLAMAGDFALVGFSPQLHKKDGKRIEKPYERWTDIIFKPYVWN